MGGFHVVCKRILSVLPLEPSQVKETGDVSRSGTSSKLKLPARRPMSPQVSRQKLLEAAMRVFAESGFRGATTRRIAEAAGVNEVTLFRQFKSKSALINEVAALYARQRSEEALPVGPENPLRELAEWCEAHLTILRNSRSMIRKCMAEVDELPLVEPQPWLAWSNPQFEWPRSSGCAASRLRASAPMSSSSGPCP